MPPAIEVERIVEDPIVTAYLKHLQDRNFDYLSIAKQELISYHRRSPNLSRQINDRSTSKGY